MQEKSTIITTAITLEHAHKEAITKSELKDYTSLTLLEQAAAYLAIEYSSPKSYTRKQCPVCSKFFANYRNMQRHFQNLHTKTKYQSLNKKDKDKNNT